MKITLKLCFVLMSLTVLGQNGTGQAIESYLENQFNTIENVSEMISLSGNQNCEERLSVLVTGNRGSGTTNHKCILCLTSDEGFVAIDSTHSECYRESH